MSALSVRLPDSVHETVKALAEKDNISINQFISSAVIEKITALETEKYLSMICRCVQQEDQEKNWEKFLILFLILSQI